MSAAWLWLAGLLREGWGHNGKLKVFTQRPTLELSPCKSPRHRPNMKNHTGHNQTLGFNNDEYSVRLQKGREPTFSTKCPPGKDLVLGVRHPVELWLLYIYCVTGNFVPLRVTCGLKDPYSLMLWELEMCMYEAHIVRIPTTSFGQLFPELCGCPLIFVMRIVCTGHISVVQFNFPWLDHQGTFKNTPGGFSPRDSVQIGLSCNLRFQTIPDFLNLPRGF